MTEDEAAAYELDQANAQLAADQVTAQDVMLKAQTQAAAAQADPSLTDTLQQTVAGVAGAAKQSTQAAATATTIMLYGVAGLALWMIWQESKTHEGRSGFARGAGHAASGAVKTTAAAGGIAAKSFL